MEVKSGTLLKRTDGPIHRWARRWVSLNDDGILSYYETQPASGSGASAKGTFDTKTLRSVECDAVDATAAAASASTTAAPESEHAALTLLFSGAGGKKLQLRAETGAEARAWAAVLRKAAAKSQDGAKMAGMDAFVSPRARAASSSVRKNSAKAREVAAAAAAAAADGAATANGNDGGGDDDFSQVDSMSLRELKGVLDDRGVDYRTCIEKGDFRALARRCLADAAAATAAAAADRAALLRRVLRRPEAPWAVLRPLSDLARALASDEEGGNDDEELIAIVGGPMTALAKLLGATVGGRGAADDDADRSIAPAQSARVRARLTQVHAMFGAWGVGKASSVNLFPNQFNAAADLDAARALLLPTSPHALRCPVFVVPTEACQRPPNPSPSAAYLREPSATAALLFPGASTTAAARAAGARSEFLALYALWGGCQSKPAHSMCVFDLAPVLSAVPRFRAGFDWAPARFFMSADDSVMQLGLASDDASRSSSSVARLDLLAARAAQQK